MDDGLVQIRIRTAVYLVPSKDFGVFTYGRLPRDPDAVRELERVADAIDGVLEGQPRRHGEVFRALGPETGRAVWPSAVLGRWRVWWNTRTSWLVPCDSPTIEAESARRELVRRFVSWFGPTTPERFARWAEVSESDARASWDGVRDELVSVHVDGKPRGVRERDIAMLTAPGGTVSGARLLPPGDPYLYPDRAYLVPSAARYDLLYKAKGEAAGAILLDGCVAGTWSRQAHRVTLRPWHTLDARRTEMLEAEASAMAGPIGRPIQLRYG